MANVQPQDADLTSLMILSRYLTNENLKDMVFSAVYDAIAAQVEAASFEVDGAMNGSLLNNAIVTLKLAAIDKDATNISGHDVVGPLCNGQRLTQVEGFESTVYALLAMNSFGYEFEGFEAIPNGYKNFILGQKINKIPTQAWQYDA